MKMSESIDPNDVYHVLRTVLDELPPGTANLEREDKWGRSQLTPTRKGAAGLYGIGSIEDCEIGIVKLTHSHFHAWSDAVDFCRAVVRGGIEYDVWRDGDRVVRAQRIHQDRNIVDVTEALAVSPEKELRKETVRFEPYA
jgi:hypothetical protein